MAQPSSCVRMQYRKQNNGISSLRGDKQDNRRTYPTLGSRQIHFVDITTHHRSRVSRATAW